MEGRGIELDNPGSYKQPDMALSSVVDHLGSEIGGGQIVVKREGLQIKGLRNCQALPSRGSAHSCNIHQ